jgi:hypothetical protein
MLVSMRVAVACLALTLLGCDEAPPAKTVPSASASAEPRVAWPALPKDRAELETLLESQTRRQPPHHVPLSADVVVAAVKRGIENGVTFGGMAAITEELQRKRDVETSSKRMYLLFGGHHDAGGQIDAFRRLVGPLGLSSAPLAAVEQLQSDGDWAGIDRDEQRGDSEMVHAWHETGDDEELALLLETQRKRNYTAWKYRYVDRIADLLLSAHSSKRGVIGCDMPSALQAETRERLGPDGDVLRDLHCAYTLERALAKRPQQTIALLWGDAHLAPSRLPRFLPSVSVVVLIHLLGHRASSDVGVEAQLPLRITAPLLVPLNENRFVMLLDGPHLRAKTDRVRATRKVDRASNVKVVGATGELQLGSAKATLDGNTWTTSVVSGQKTFFWQPAEGQAIAGGFELPAGGGVELDFTEPGVLRITTLIDPRSR